MTITETDKIEYRNYTGKHIGYIFTIVIYTPVWDEIAGKIIVKELHMSRIYIHTSVMKSGKDGNVRIGSDSLA